MAEILAPVKSVTSIEEVMRAGAHRVYLGIASYSREGSRGSISESELRTYIEKTQISPTKIHVALNVVPREEEISHLHSLVGRLHSAGVIHFILNDLGLIREVKKIFPRCRITASVGLKSTTVQDCLFLDSIGAFGVVMPIGVSPEDVRLVKDKTRLTVEVFAYCRGEPLHQGTCMLPGYVGDPRREESEETASAKRTGVCAEVCRRFFSRDPHDLRGNVRPWIDAGVDILKIEGRYRKPGEIRDIATKLRNEIDSLKETGKKVP